MLRRRLSIVLLLAALASCATANRPPTLPARAEVVRVGTSLDYRPFSDRGPDGEPEGIDVDLVKRWAVERHRTIRFVPFRWSELTARFASGELDVVASGVTVRGDRLVLGPMTVSTARTRALVLMPPGGAAGGVPRRVAVNRGGHLEQLARRRLPASELVVVDDNRRLVETVRGGAAEALVTDSAEAEALGLVGPPATAAWEVAAVLAHDRKAFWVAPTHPELLEDLDRWLPANLVMPATLRSARLIELLERRLMLMPEVALAKRAAGLPVEDRAREEKVVARARQAATAAGLDAESWATFVRAQMEAAKAVQAATSVSEEAAARPPFSLERQLRPAIDRVDGAIVAEAARLAPVCDPAEAIEAALREDEPVTALEPALMRQLVAAVRQIRPLTGQRACR